MIEINYNTDPLAGPPDGVSAKTECAVTTFTADDDVANHVTVQCLIRCSYSEGLINFSMPEIRALVNFRLDDFVGLLKAASEAARGLAGSMPQEFKDAEVEARWREFRNVRFVESDCSPSGMILESDWWVYPAGADFSEIVDDIYAKHSLGAMGLAGIAGNMRKPDDE